jgi:hypothetical protein
MTAFMPLLHSYFRQIYTVLVQRKMSINHSGLNFPSLLKLAIAFAAATCSVAPTGSRARIPVLHNSACYPECTALFDMM